MQPIFTDTSALSQNSPDAIFRGVIMAHFHLRTDYSLHNGLWSRLTLGGAPSYFHKDASSTFTQAHYKSMHGIFCVEETEATTRLSDTDVMIRFSQPKILAEPWENIFATMHPNMSGQRVLRLAAFSSSQTNLIVVDANRGKFRMVWTQCYNIYCRKS